MHNYDEALSKPYVSGLVDRFLRYAKIDTQSDRHIEDIPSTKTQWNLAHLLVDELKSLGISDVSLDDHCYIIARVPASPGLEHKPVVGLMAHMDTASDVPGSDVRPSLIKGYDGKRIQLAAEGVLDPA